MGETSRFLRFVLPSLVFVILLLISFIILRFQTVLFLFKNNQLTDKISVSTALGGLIVLGGLGYMFAIIYFAVYWIFSRFGKHFFNHLTTLNNLSEYIRVINPSGEEIKIKDKAAAWFIINTYWHRKTKISKAMAGVDERLDRYYSDITTSLGTTVVATILSLAAFVYLCFTYYSTKTISIELYWAVFIIYVIFLVFLFINFIKTLISYEALVNITIATQLKKDFDNYYEPVTIVIPDLENHSKWGKVIPPGNNVLSGSQE